MSKEEFNRKYIESYNIYNSETTSCYEDSNGNKHLFIYTNPIRYFDGSGINIKIKKNQYKGYKKLYFICVSNGNY